MPELYTFDIASGEGGGHATFELQFPFEAYDCQLKYMRCVLEALHRGENALLESPTGTGKTLSLLCAALAWQRRVKPAKKGKAPTIIYASRTHSQLSQVIGELKSTAYRPRMSVLASRQQMCVHRDISQLAGTAQNMACKAAVASRACRHFIAVDAFAHANQHIGSEPLDIEDLAAIGRLNAHVPGGACGPCPYFLSREMAKSADIVFVPYNYVVDDNMRQSLGIDWTSAVVIFDEAHNLENVCAEASSFDLPAAHLAMCIQEANECWELAVGAEDGAPTQVGRPAEDFRLLKSLLRMLEQRIAQEVSTGNAVELSKDAAFLFDVFTHLNITVETLKLLLDTIDDATGLLASEAAAAGRKGGARKTQYRLHDFKQALEIAFRSLASQTTSSYRVWLSSVGGKGPCLSYWCMQAGTSLMQFQNAGVRSILLTSGTLSPMDSFAHELHLPFPIRLENSHVIAASQIWVSTLNSGPSNCALNSSFNNRDKPEYKRELGDSLLEIARIVPDGILVFFASYTALSSAVDAWSAGPQPNVWHRLSRLKHLVVEPRDQSQFAAARIDFEEKINDKAFGGAMLFAVCRGKVSEGLNFADRAGRAVVITGIPFPMITDPKVALKREYLDGCLRQSPGGLSGEKWYIQNAMRAVNQALGRIIRHRNDYGAVLLADARFSGLHHMLSTWIRPHLMNGGFRESMSSLSQFFRVQAGSVLPEPVQRKVPATSRLDSSYSVDDATQAAPMTALEGIPGVATLLAAPIAGMRRDAQQAGGGLLSALKSQARDLSEPPPLVQQRQQFVPAAEQLAKPASAHPASQPAPPVGPKDFLQRARAALDDAQYAKFQAVLRAFKSHSITFEMLMIEMSTLLHDVTLLQALGPFIPAEHQAAFLLKIQERRGTMPPPKLDGLKRSAAEDAETKQLNSKFARQLGPQ